MAKVLADVPEVLSSARRVSPDPGMRLELCDLIVKLFQNSRLSGAQVPVPAERI